MHYKNGREVKKGDMVVGTDISGKPISGIVVELYPGTDTCNAGIMPGPINTWTVTTKDLLHIDDFKKE